VKSWYEAYGELLPQEELNRRTVETRLKQWTNILSDPSTKVAYANGLGFASFGPQRDEKLSKTIPYELYALYILKQVYGSDISRQLFNLVKRDCGEPFSTCVLERNFRAAAFYEKMGGNLLYRQKEMLGKTPICERIYVWNVTPRHNQIDKAHNQ
jgi:hypothetical protein